MNAFYQVRSFLSTYYSAMETELALARLSLITGLPVVSFRDDALRWCSTQVSSALSSLEYAAQEVAAGRLFPWVEDGPA